MAGGQGVVANTDQAWFDYLASLSASGHLDEVNFWRPRSTSFRALQPGAPVFFRLKHPRNAIAGFGYFAHFTILPVQLAWMTFGIKNGDPTFERFLNRIAAYRGESPAETATGGRPVGCIVLREVRLLPGGLWVAWNQAEEWHPNIVAYKGYDLAEGAGQKLATLLTEANLDEFDANFELLDADNRRMEEQLAAIREGQGAFRLRVLDAYGRRCAVTGERSLPALEAAHIQSYMGPASNHVQNGLSLRADIHGLYDAGYVTVTPALQFEVSRRLREDFENGRDYYALDGKPLLVLPRRARDLPSPEALAWHSNRIYKG